MEKIVECPFCMSQHLANDDEANFYCPVCDRFYDKEDIEIEDLRHRMSHLLIDTDEEHQIPIEMPFGENDPETFGLSSLDLPWTVSVYQIPGDGTIWFKMDYNDETGEDAYINFDDVSIEDLRSALKILEEER